MRRDGLNDEIERLTNRDAARRIRRNHLRSIWRDCPDARKAAAVRLAEHGYGIEKIAVYAGVPYEDAATLVTGE